MSWSWRAGTSSLRSGDPLARTSRTVNAMMHAAMSTVVLAADNPEPAAGAGQLVAAALIGIAVIVLLIVQVKLHPFLSLTIGSLVVAIVAGVNLADATRASAPASATRPPGWAR